MENITLNDEFTIKRIKSDELFSAIEFVINTNYTHHQCAIDSKQLRETIEDIHLQESEIFNRSYFYEVVDKQNQIIGTLRIADWDKSEVPQWLVYLQANSIHRIYHIGRFAVNQSEHSNPLGGKNIFRQLVLIAFSYICQDPQNILIAECDIKLFRTLKKMGIDLIQIGKSEFCLGSETVCVYATYETIQAFYSKYQKN